MKTLYLRNVPDDVVERLERLAVRDSMSVNAVAVRELAEASRRADNPRLLAALPDLGFGAAEVVADLDAGARPTMIVLDASAALSAMFNDGPARHAVATENVQVPHLIDSEVSSGIRRRVRAGQLASDVGWQLLQTWSRLGVTRYPVVGLLDRIWELRDNLSAYDAGYVALAEALGCGLLTADGRLASAPGVRCPITVVR